MSLEQFGGAAMMNSVPGCCPILGGSVVMCLWTTESVAGALLPRRVHFAGWLIMLLKQSKAHNAV